MELKIDIGGGDGGSATIHVEGCDCRMNDFVLALVGFANEWRRDADAYASKRDQLAEIQAAARADAGSTPTKTKKPCGCGK